jgi:hypothetical protein
LARRIKLSNAALGSVATAVHPIGLIVAVSQTTTVKDRDKAEQHRGLCNEFDQSLVGKRT